MECEQSITLLSDFHDDALDEMMKIEVRTHLAECPPCDDVFHDLHEIVELASGLRDRPEIAFADEEAIWQRLPVSARNMD